MSQLVQESDQSRCVLVLGMHRSGTSAATRCMNLVGMDLGSHLLDPDSVNAKGYWEHAEAVRINDELLAAFGMAWWSLDPLPEGWLDSEPASRARDAIKALVKRDFQQVPLWGIKDPRLCRLAPLWIDCLAAEGISVSAVFTTRSPLEVSRSLVRAQGLSEGAGVLSWVLHLAEAERATRDLPRTLIRYDQLLAGPVAMLERIGSELGFAWPVPPASRAAALAAFLDASMRTHRSVPKSGWVPPIAERMDAVLQDVSQANESDAWRSLGALADEAVELIRLLDYRRRSPLPHEVATPADADKGSPVQAALYHAVEGETFSEDRAVHRPVLLGRSQVEFPVHHAPGARYRLDPASRSGYYVFHSVALRDAERRLLWTWEESPEQVSCSGIYPLESPSHPGSVVHRVDGDPQMTFAWPEGLVIPGAVLVLDVERFGVQRIAREFDALEQQFGTLVRELDANRNEASERERELQSELQRVRAARDERERTFKSVEEHVARLETSVGQLHESLAHQNAALHALLSRDLWSRLRRRFGRVRPTLQPQQHLDAIDAADGHYRVTGNDPIFNCAFSGYPMAPGWYLVDLEMKQHQGPPAQAALYPDYGPGAPPEMRGIRLPFFDAKRERHTGLVRFCYPVFGLRFDPAIAPCELSVRSLELRRVGKGRAALELFRWLRRGEEGLGGLWEKLRASGLSGAAEWAYARYAAPTESASSYDAWLASYDVVSERDISDARARAARWAYRPVISVLVPTYNTEEMWLRRCVESVLAQAYPHWELCVADDASPQPHVVRILQEYAARDARVRVVQRTDNGHISASSNSALALATGDYVALLDHDDELHPLALYEVVAALQSHRDWKLIYTDEDKIDQAGKRYDPYMKPDWNYDLLLGHNCISHLGVYQRQLLEKIGGFREGYEGSQDWDLALRCIEQLSPGEIGHVPRVLYHWRAIPGSTSVGVGEKDYTRNAALKAIADHIERVGADASVEEIDDRPGNFRVRYRLSTQPKVTLVIPTRDGLDLLRQCIDSILERTTYENYEVVIVDNQSSDPATLEYFRAFDGHSRVRVLKFDHPFNYSAINNFAVEQTSGELICLVNNDIEVISPDWIEEMAAHAMRPEIGAVGAMLYYPNDTIQHAGVVLGMHGVAAHAYCGEPRGWPGQMGRARLTQSMSAVTAACLMVRREVYEEVGGLDETLKVAFNDVDFCLRIRQAGYRNLWTPFAELYHHESATRGREDTEEKMRRFTGEVAHMTATWREELVADPCYNPNLTLVDAPFMLAFPPRGGTND